MYIYTYYIHICIHIYEREKKYQKTLQKQVNNKYGGGMIQISIMQDTNVAKKAVW